jgi:hypothetical protein
MVSGSFFSEQIEKELGMARAALQAGNAGKARVCARRACGRAITWFLTKFPHPNWNVDAVRQLQHLSQDQSVPVDVRNAATRLTTKISDQFLYPFSTHSIDDALVIVNHIKSLMTDGHD